MPAMFFTFSLPVFMNLICHIFFLIAKENMVWIYTTFNVASM